MADESTKRTEDPAFKGGVMSPNAKRTFAEMRETPVITVPRQKLIFDEDIFEESFLRCMVCRERYDMNDKSPRLLPCHHAFCMACIMTFFAKEAEYRQSMAITPSTTTTFAVSIACPHCQANFITTEEGLKQLITDHRIVQLMDFVGNTDKQTVVFCPSHAHQPLNFFCEKCEQTICRDCTVLDHKSCSEEKCVFDIHGAIQKYKPAIEEGKNNLGSELKSLEEKKTECEQALEGCAKGDDTLTKQIKDSFEKLRKAIDEREAELLGLAKSGQGNTEQVVEEKIKNLVAKQNELAAILENVDEAMASGAVHDLFSVYRKVRDFKTEPGLDNSAAEQKESSTSTFITRDEVTLVSRIAHFGDIQTSTRQSNGHSSYGGVTSSYSSGSSYVPTPRYSGYTGSTYSSRYTPTRSYKY